jgi:MFS family permease
MELHMVSTFADALIVTALASTIFFAVPTEQARGQVAASLVMTMVPFVILAPVIGPMLDRVRHGRRYAIAGTMAARAFLAWVMAGAVGSGQDSQTALSLYPAAFGFLVSQKAYIVTRAAAVPRVLPIGTGLVTVNARLSLAGVAAMSLGAPLGAGITAVVGPSWTLRLAFLVFAAGTVLSFLLSPRVDSSLGEVPARLSGRVPAPPAGQGTTSPRTGPIPSPAAGAAPRAALWRRSRATGPHVVLGLRINVVLRVFTGFLTLFLAFRLRTEPLDGMPATTAVALVVILAAVGSGVGTALGGLLRRIRPETAAILSLLLTSVVAVWSTVSYGLWPVLAVAAVAGLGQGWGKLCLDAMIQRDVLEEVRTSTFARSETMMQLAWVGGGGIGLALPLSGVWGLGIAAAGVCVATVALVSSLLNLPAPTPPDAGGRTRHPST